MRVTSAVEAVTEVGINHVMIPFHGMRIDYLIVSTFASALILAHSPSSTPPAIYPALTPTDVRAEERADCRHSA